MIRQNIRLVGTLFWGLLAAAAGDKPFSPPPAAPPNTYPAHETHQDENVSIAIDPYDTPDKATIFKIKYRRVGFLPIRLIIANEGSSPLMLDDLRIEFITSRRDKIEPATKDDILRRITRPEKADPQRPLPFPLPRKSQPVKKDDRIELDSAAFVTFPITPHSTSSGFLFFDIQGIDNPEAGAHVYISGIRAGAKELFYFDIPLERYLQNAAHK